MAARIRSGTKTSPWPERTKNRIRTSMLINRLEKLAFGEIPPESMPPHAVTAALGLIKKELGDKATVEHTGDGLRAFAFIPEQMDDVAAWQDQFTPKSKVEH